ncbi:MAG: Cna B-type domain-containing protein [Coriobacteriia bacterium]|nr:Cna B-type domain-containing protein [Coriobacteriia bacterium]
MLLDRLTEKGIRSTVVRRGLSILLAALFVFSAFMSGSYAWSALNQSALNEAQGEGNGYPVQLVKYEKLPDGTTTKNPIAGAEFYLYASDGTQIDGRFVTDDKGTISTRVKPGTYYFEETDPSYGWTYDKNGAGADVKRYPFTVLGNETDMVVVTAYNRHITGNLTITKTVQNSDGSSLTQEQTDTAFSFTVTFSDKGSYTYKINGGASQSLTSGGAIQLKHGESAVFEGIPVGVGYVVTEAVKADYVTSSTNSSGDITAGGVTATFINTYTVRPDEYGSLVVTKEVTGEGADNDKQFEFTVLIGGDSQTIYLKSGDSQTFDQILVGTDYTVTESDYSADGYTATVSEYSGTISTKDVVITLPFVNVYQPPTENGSLKIGKTVTGDGADPAKTFSFTVTFAGPDAPDPAVQTFALKSGETKTFSDIPAGVTYTVVETAANGYAPNFTEASGTIVGNEVATVGFVNAYEEHQPEKTALIIKKVGTGEGFDTNKEFSFTVTINGQALPDKVTLKAGQQSDPIELNVGDNYEVVEDSYVADGYLRTSLTYGNGTAVKDTITITQTNTYIGPVLITISGEKTWDKHGQEVELPASIAVRLKNGTTVVETVVVEPDKEGAWKYSFSAPKYNPQGEEISYTVDEVPITGWKASYEGKNIKNTYITPVTDTALEVQKVLVGTPAEATTFKFILTSLNGAPLPLGAAAGVKTITISGAGSADFGAITYTTAGTYAYTVAELNTDVDGYRYDESVYTYTVTIAEQDGVLVVTNKTLTKNNLAAEEALFTNTYEADKTSVKVTKAWNDANDPNRPTSIQVQLYRDSVASGSPVTLDAGNDWSHIFTGLEKGPQWTVDEAQTPVGYTKTVSGDPVNGFIITNTKSGGGGEKTSISVKKVWNDNKNPDRPTSVQVQLYKGGNAQGTPVALNSANGWKYTWQDLDKNAVWTVNEISIPSGYAKAITGNATSGYTITNTRKESPPGNQEVTIAGKKIWYQGKSAAEKLPASLVVILKADGVIVLQKQITATDYWSWTFTPPKYAADGHVIKYTIDEARINDYTKKISGYDITNTYNPGHNTDETPGTNTPGSNSGGSGTQGKGNWGGNGSPKTGDTSNLVLWVSLLAVSSLGLVGMWIVHRKRKKVYQPQH